MIRFGQMYNLSSVYQIAKTKTSKTEEDAIDTPKDTSTKQEQNIGKGDDYRQWNYPKDGGETFAEAIVKQGKPGPNATLSDVVNYYTAYETLYGVKPGSEENTDNSDNDTRTIYFPAGLRAYGITDENIINQYFDDRGIQDGSKYKGGQSERGYSLKTDIEINGKIITTIEELVEALGIKND